VATAEQHEELYAALRAKVLARHFAIGRYFRANLLSLANTVAEPSTEAMDGLTGIDIERLRRWNVVDHFRENPLLESGKLFSALAIEFSLGYRQSAVPLARGIETVASLFPVRIGEAGWLVRWDPVTSDKWDLAPDGRPAVCREFLVGDDGTYQYCLPATDPRRVPWRSAETLQSLLPQPEARAYLWEDAAHWQGYHRDFFDCHEVWEGSMDEIAGLVAGLIIADRLVGRRGSAAVRRAVAPPARLLGEYLADNGYILVRPCGGLNARGATGALPAMELPLSRALGSITGREYASRLDFYGALEHAGYARNLDGPIRALAAAAVAGSLVIGPLVVGLGALAPLVGAPIGALAGTALEVAARTVGPVQIGTAAALFLHRDCYDVSNDASAQDVALAYLLKEFEPRLRFAAWMAGIQAASREANARGFPPHLALSALDDPDPTVRDSYLALYRAERARGPAAEDQPGLLDSAHAMAVAVLLGATEFEDLLATKLDGLYTRFDGMGQDASLGANPDELRLVIDYLAGVALAWLHAQRAFAAGAPITTSGFPMPPTSFPRWPKPTVPRIVLERLPEVRRAVLGDRAIPTGDALDLFSSGVATRKQDPPTIILPDPGPLVGEFIYTVAESARDVFTGITLQWGDEYEIESTGEIWAGGALTGSNGPNGQTDQLVDDARWPLHSGLDPSHAHPFALLARVGGWFFVGEHMKRRRFLSPHPLPLHLRINDDRPGNGSGAFRAIVRLWGTPRKIVYPERSILCATRTRQHVETIGGTHPDGKSWRLTVEEAIEWVERYGHTFTTGTDAGPRVVVIRTRGRASLRSRGDRTRANNLRSLPSCPDI
jgi:hypothetical protein